MKRTTRTLSVSLPPDWYTELEEMARASRKSKSQLFREMMLAYRESAGGPSGGRPSVGRESGTGIASEGGLVESRVLARLSMRARAHGRTVEDEIGAILEEAAGGDMERAREAARSAQERTKGRIRGDSADLIAEDRLR